MKKLLVIGLVALVAAGTLAFTLAQERDDARYVDVHFTRAVQVFPGNSVRVLGVSIGRVISVQNDQGDAVVRFRIDDPDVKLPADVKATVIPVSLLGERYIQLFPSYSGGPTFDGSDIPLERTSVPVEQDELLRSLQDYFGQLDPKRVHRFVSNASRILDGNGGELNRLIKNGTGVIATLSDKRDSLAHMIENFNTITQTLSTRQSEIATLIKTYNIVARTLNDNRDALEGTIEGLNLAAVQLADLLTAHRDPLGKDVRALTHTSRILNRNVNRLARTSHWADRLFSAASRAADYKRDWLRLNNQGEPLFALIETRLQDRLVGVCLRLGMDKCSTQAFWSQKLPDMFCLRGDCSKRKTSGTAGDQLNKALEQLPNRVGDEIGNNLGSELTGDLKDLTKNCKDAKHPRRCRKRKENLLDPGQTLDDLLDELQDQVGDATGGLPGTGGLP